MYKLQDYGGGWIWIEDLRGCLLHHSIHYLETDRHSSSLVISYDPKELKVENVEVRCAPWDSYLLQQRFTEDRDWDSLDLLEQSKELSHQLLSDLNMRMKLDEKESERFVNDRCELVPVDTEVLQQFEHDLETGRPQYAHAITTATLHYG